MKLLILGLLLTGQAAFAGQALNEWQRSMGIAPMQVLQGSQGGYWEQQREKQQQQQRQRQTDMVCKRDCLNLGYTHPLCDSRCSY